MDDEAIRIKRPPLDFEISPEFATLLNRLVDAIESGDYITQCGLEDEVWAQRRELAEGSDEEEWVMSYYFDRGWKHGME